MPMPSAHTAQRGRGSGRSGHGKQAGQARTRDEVEDSEGEQNRGPPQTRRRLRKRNAGSETSDDLQDGSSSK